jgi:dipeptide/tripeptide permease
MSKHKHKESYIAEYGIKLLMVFYLASVFFYSETLDPANNLDTKISILFVSKLVVLVAFSIFILAVEEKIFKIVGFSAIILGAFYKMLLIVSQDNFAFHQILSLGDSVMLIGVSLYYLYRHRLKQKVYEHKKKRKSKRLEAFDDLN